MTSLIRLRKFRIENFQYVLFRLIWNRTFFLMTTHTCVCVLHYIQRHRMKIAIRAVFGVIFCTSAAYADNCANYNALEEMSCQVGYLWDDELKECVQAPQT